MIERVSTFLMFEGRAEEALDLYRDVFRDLEVGGVVRYDADNEAMDGKVYRAEFTLGGQRFRLFDSPSVHDFGFTPAISIFVDLASAEELDRAFAALSEGGEVFMPLDAYDFSRRFAWVADRFGVSWQLNLP